VGLGEYGVAEDSAAAGLGTRQGGAPVVDGTEPEFIARLGRDPGHVGAAGFVEGDRVCVVRSDSLDRLVDDRRILSTGEAASES